LQQLFFTAFKVTTVKIILVFSDDFFPVAIYAYGVRVAPIGASADIDIIFVGFYIDDCSNVSLDILQYLKIIGCILKSILCFPHFKGVFTAFQNFTGMLTNTLLIFYDQLSN
jgi:hypothetical protein